MDERTPVHRIEGLGRQQLPPELMPRQRRALQQQMAPNPFAVEQYRNIGLPDMPVSFGGGMTETMLNNSEVPEEIRNRFWYIFHKDNVLTFLDEDRKESKLLNYDIIKIDILNSIPYYDYTFEQELQFDMLRNVLETKLDRALGFKGQNIKNERIMLQSQFSEQRHISETGDGGPIKEGFFKRLLGRR